MRSQLKYTFKRVIDNIKQFFGAFEVIEGIANITQNQSIVRMFDYSSQVSHLATRATFAGPRLILEFMSPATLG